MRHLRIVLTLMIALGAAGFTAGCGSEPAAAPPEETHPGLVRLKLEAQNLRTPREGEYLIVWFRMQGQDVWTQAVRLQSLKVKTLNDLTMYFPFQRSLDSVEGVSLSVEVDSNAASPTSVFMLGSMTRGVASLGFVADSLASRTTALAGDITFTTLDVDTSLANQEFYLMRRTQSGMISSLRNLPLPPDGWVYGLWVVDSNFFPIYATSLGTFREANGHDSDSIADAYAFPGGRTVRVLDNTGTRIILTLEPERFSAGASGPYPMNLLWANAPQHIHLNRTIAMTNVTKNLVPSVKLTFTPPETK